MAELTNLINTLRQYTSERNYSLVSRPSCLKFVRNYSQFLDALVKIDSLIGLAEAKYKIALLVQSFIINYKLEGVPVHSEKMNVFLCGASGCGKTLLGQYLAQLFAASGCIAEKSGDVFEIEKEGQKNPVSQSNPAIHKEFIINLGPSPPPNDNEKIALKTKLAHYRARLAKTDLAIIQLLTQFNNVRKKIGAKNEAEEGNIQAKLQKIKLVLKSCISEDANLTLNALKELMATKKNTDSIVPVTVPTLPGRPNTFELRNSTQLLITSSSNSSLIEQSSEKPDLPPDLEKEVEIKFVVLTRGDVIGKYQGHTEEKIRKILNKYIGGVIMFDEAYALTTGSYDDFGQIILSEIVNFMTQHPGKIIFIFAGYKETMKHIFEMQQGLQRRFEMTIEIANYTSDELADIFVGQVKQLGLDCEEIKERIKDFFKVKREHFPNSGGSTSIFAALLKQKIYSDVNLLASALDDKVGKQEFGSFRKVTMNRLNEAFELYLNNSVFHTYKDKCENLSYFN
ncbi:MAG: AAA family ATPase [Solivirus sp.]|uniref:AAA family ATPase n=1 Tax=Solivirus sp. TaxID=2487772 RepID=A0A3G5AJU7_9VIRU|nr:MAG: AAA family ATPase [Solivirus sp.]